jgi:23S rRNA (uridine2552-2'-O)-methyltransferase
MARARSGRKHGNPYAKPDLFTQRAKAAGYPARSVFKLEEIDRRVRLLRGGMRVLDLGCAPGSWILFVAQRIGPSGRVRGVDLTPLEIALPPNAQSMAGDVFTPTSEIDAFLKDLAPYDVVLSDMAPNTSGNRLTDQVRSAELVAGALDLAGRLLARGGTWVAKIFMSDEVPALRARVRAMFESERIIRPEGTRAHSTEVFLVGERKRGTT